MAGGCNCSGCNGCGNSLELTEPELTVLYALGQYSFLPIARRPDSEMPVCLEFEAMPADLCGMALLCLEKKALISLSYEKPLPGADMSAYSDYSLHGSMALTARGRQVLDLLETYGVES